MEQIDARRALELLIDVVDQYGEDTVYEKVPLDNGGAGCRYEYSGAPSCLVGHALSSAGADLAELASLDRMSLPADRLHAHVSGVSAEAARMFQSAQDIQDRGGVWGDAVDAARKQYEFIKAREAQ